MILPYLNSAGKHENMSTPRKELLHDLHFQRRIHIVYRVNVAGQRPVPHSINNTRKSILHVLLRIIQNYQPTYKPSCKFMNYQTYQYEFLVSHLVYIMAAL